MAVKVLNRSFAAGEISPECYGRLDLVRFQAALAIARNFVTLPHGPAVSRGGFKYVIETKDSTKQSVLLPFSFNTEQTYILEFGNQYIRFHTNGGTLLETAKNITGITQPAGVVTINAHGYSNGQWVYLTGIGGMTQLNGRFVVVSDSAANTFRMKDFAGNYITTGTYGAYTAGGTAARVYEIASPYLEADLFELHIAQSADVLTITHSDYAPRELSRLAAASWTLTAVDFRNGPFLDTNDDKRRFLFTLDYNKVRPPTTKFDGLQGDITIEASADVFTAADVGRLVYIEKAHQRSVSPLTIAFWGAGGVYATGVRANHGENEYYAILGGTAGSIPPTHEQGVSLDGTAGSNVHWYYVSSGYGVAKIISYVNAREVKAEVQTTFPSQVVGGYGPTTLNTWLHNGNAATTSFAIAGATKPASSDYFVTVDNVRQIPEEEYFIDVAGGLIHFFVTPPVGVNNISIVEKGGSMPSQLPTTWALGAWSSTTGYPGAVSYFGGRIGYAGSNEEPQDLWLSRAGKYKDFGRTLNLADDEAINIALADGQVNRVRDLVALDDLVALTSSRAWQIVGDADGVLTPTATAKPGAAVGISSVQAEVVGKQALYVDAIGNAIHKLYYGSLQTGETGYLSDDLSVLAEHLLRNKTITDIAFQRRPYPILWCVRSDGYLLGMTYNPQHDVVGWHQHITDGSFESVAVVNEDTEDALYAVVKRTINGRTVRYIERQQSRRFITLADCFLVDAGLAYSGAAVSTVTGFWHLEGEEITGLADGVVFTKTVTNGSITLDVPASKVNGGLGYTCDLQSLPLSLAPPAPAGGQALAKNLDAVYLRLIDSSGIQAGPNFEQLNEMLQREEETYGSPPEVVSGLRKVPSDATWTDDGQVCVRQAYPLPVTVSAMVLEVSLGS